MKRTKQKSELAYNQTEDLIIEAFKSTGFLIVNKKLIKLFGLIGAVVLSNYIDKYQYFKNARGSSFDGWFFLRHKDVMEHLQLKENAIIAVKKWFIKLEFLIVKRKGIPAKEWFFIDFEKLADYVFQTSHEGLDPQKIRGLDIEKIRGLIKETKSKEIKSNNGIVGNQFEIFWKSYPKKINKGKALKAWITITNKKDKPTLDLIQKALVDQIDSDQWQVKKYIPHAATWLNQYGWLNDASEMKNYDRSYSKENKPVNAYNDNLNRNYDA